MKRLWDSGEARVFGRRLRDARLRKGLSLRDAARQARVSASFLSRIEHGERCPAAIVAARLAAVLDEDLQALLDHVANPGVGNEAPTTALAETDSVSPACLSCQWRAHRLLRSEPRNRWEVHGDAERA